MKTSDAIRAGLALLRHRTGDVLPVYLATTAAGVVGQSIVIVGAAVAFLSLYVTGRIRRVVELGRDLDLAAFQDGTVSPAEEAFFEAVADLVTPTVVLSLVAAGVVALLVVVVVRGLTAAAKVHTARALLAGDPPVVAGVRGARADARTFVAFVALQAILVLGPPAVGGSVALLALAAGGPGGAALAVLVALATVLVWLPVLAVFYFGLLFVREAIVVEGVGLRDGIRRNLSFIADRPVRAVLYVFFEAGLLVLTGTAANLAGLLGVSRVVALASTLFVLPVLGLVKMAVYVEPSPRPADAAPGSDPAGVPADAASGSGSAGVPADTAPGSDPAGVPADDDVAGTGPDGPTGPGREDPSAVDPAPGERSGGSAGGSAPADGSGAVAEPRSSARTVAVEGVPPGDDRGALAALRADLSRGLRDGVAELSRFARGSPGLVGVATLVFLVGVAGGYATVAPLGIDVTTEAGGGFGVFPLDTALQLSANNWLVAIGQAYAGMALGVPVVVNLLFNGAIVGGLAGVGFDPLVFAALVVPHALLEVPALAVSGALGFHLAARTYAFARARRSAETFAADLRWAFRVLVGLLPVFLVAGFVEAFLTPLVGEAVRAAVGG